MTTAVQEFTFGTTPPEVIREALGSDNYPMELVGDEADIVRDIVNQGIDSHLEAVSGDFKWGTRNLSNGTPFVKVLKCSVTPDGMLCLLRRLEEHGSEESDMLRSDILMTLDIDEI